MQAQHGFVKLDTKRQNLAEFGLGNAQNSGFTLGIGIMGAPIAVKYRDVTKPDAQLKISQGDLFAGNGR